MNAAGSVRKEVRGVILLQNLRARGYATRMLYAGMLKCWNECLMDRAVAGTTCDREVEEAFRRLLVSSNILSSCKQDETDGQLGHEASDLYQQNHKPWFRMWRMMMSEARSSVRSVQDKMSVLSSGSRTWKRDGD